MRNGMSPRPMSLRQVSAMVVIREAYSSQRMLTLDSPWYQIIPLTAYLLAGRNMALYIMVGLYISLTDGLEASARFTEE